MAQIRTAGDIYPVFRDLFAKENANNPTFGEAV